MKASKTVEEFILSEPGWQNELIELRRIMLASGLVETIKWGAPTYTFNGKNVAAFAAFKTYVAIWFYQGALLNDEQKKLINAQEGTTKALRQWRFASFHEIVPELILAYLKEAIENEKKGIRIEPQEKPKLQIPGELINKLTESKELKEKFESLSPFKQREYVEYLDEAKRAETKQKRLEKMIPLILQGIGLNDKYR